VVDDEVLVARESDVDVVLSPQSGVAEGNAENNESDQLIESRSSLLSVRRGGLMGVLGIGDIALVVVRGSSSSGSGPLLTFIACWIATVGGGRVAGGECGSGFVVK